MKIILFIGLFICQSAIAASTRIICTPGESCLVNFKTPWIVALIHTGNELSKDSIYCGGTLIDPYWVLTAAHCTKDEIAQDIQVVIGRQTLSETKSAEIIDIEQIITHSDYQRNNDENPLADIALLRLKEPSTQEVIPIANISSIKVGNLSSVMGWGKTSANNFNSFSDTLQYTSIPIVSNEVCNKIYTDDVADSMLCAGFKAGGTDGCNGDSGGPLLIKHNGAWQQIGVMSWGEGCALPNYYGVYTRVASFMDFIYQYIEKPCETLITPELQVNMLESTVNISWDGECMAKGYEFYSAPYSLPISEVTMENITAYDFGYNNKISIDLQILKMFIPYQKLYVAVRAYDCDEVKNCNNYSDYSNLGVVSLESEINQ